MATYNLTIDHTQVSSSLTDFPVYVNLNDVISGITLTQAQSTRVYQSDGVTECAREIVSATEMHFKANSISSSADTVFVLDIDGARSDYAATDTYGRNAVWSNSYLGVWHMGSGALIDSTGINPNSTANPASSVTGKVGVASSFSANFANIETVSALQSGVRSAMTVQAWFYKPSAWSGSDRAMELSNSIFMLGFAGAGSMGPLVKQSGANHVANAGTLSASTWYLQVATYDSSTGVLSGYSNGSLQGSNTYSGQIDLSDNGYLHFGADVGSSETSSSGTFTGYMDEIRFSSAARTSTWLATEYANQNSPSTFYTIGSAATTASNTQSAVARIAKAGSKTQSGSGSVAIHRSESQSGKSRVAISSSSTQTSVANITTSILSTDVIGITFTDGTILSTDQTSISRVETFDSSSQLSAARISTVVTRTQPGVGRIPIINTTNQSSVTRISRVFTNTTTGLARISKLLSVTQPSISAVENTVALAQTSISRIAKSFTSMQSTIARISGVEGATVSAKARIVNFVVRNQVAKGRITESSQKTLTGLGRISKLFTRGQASTSRVAILPTDTQDSKARISVTVSSVQLGEGRIVATVVTYQPSKARVKGQPNYTPIGIVIQSQSRKGEVGETKTVATVLSNGTMSAVSSKTKKYEVEGQETDVIVQSKTNKGTL